jgi:hypothetical protein
VAGPRFGTGSSFDDRLRLPYTQPPEVLEVAVERLARLAAAVSPGVGAGADGRLVV